jgi:hypothetical protein
MTNDTLQFGQSSVPAHCRQKTAVAKPRRLRSTSACSPRATRARMPSRRARLKMTSGPSAAYSSRMSTTVTAASGRSRTRRASTIRSYLPVMALW